jgi:flagellar biosynthesis chaperone FliJ
MHILTLHVRKGGIIFMPYHKNKQQAFQAAQQGVEDAEEVYSDIVLDSASYGQQLKHLKNEVNEAFQQIENALEVASEHQRIQLEQFQRDLQNMVNEVNQTH